MHRPEAPEHRGYHRHHRPLPSGPHGVHPRFIACKHNPEKVSYKHPALVPILSNTYGCIVYQEQVIQIFQQLGGYSLGQADMVRRAMSKKR